MRNIHGAGLLGCLSLNLPDRSVTCFSSWTERALQHDSQGYKFYLTHRTCRDLYKARQRRIYRRQACRLASSGLCGCARVVWKFDALSWLHTQPVRVASRAQNSPSTSYGGTAVVRGAKDVLLEALFTASCCDTRQTCRLED